MRGRSAARRGVAVAALVALFGAAVLPAGVSAEAPRAAEDPAPRTNLADIEGEVMCPICGTLLELSEAPQAERQRAFIRRKIAAGRSKEEIKDALVAEFGPDVLAVPADDGFDLVAWVVPGVGLAVAGVLVLLGLRRWRQSADTEDARLRELPVPLEEDEKRINEDMARYRP